MMRIPGLVLVLVTIYRCSSSELGGSWLSWSLEQAGQVSREAGSALYRGVKDLACLKLECCNQDWSKSDPVLLRDLTFHPAGPANFSLLANQLETHLVGQHLARELVVRAVRGHHNNPRPTKPLVLSFHGWTGSGKNFVSQFVAESLYRRGLSSKFVHLLIATLHFPDPAMTEQYKVQYDHPPPLALANLVFVLQIELRDWISGNVTRCKQNIFIFDEVDKMPPGVLDIVKPFMDYYEVRVVG